MSSLNVQRHQRVATASHTGQVSHRKRLPSDAQTRAVTPSSLFPSHMAPRECESPSQPAEAHAEGHTRFGSTSYVVQAVQRRETALNGSRSPASGHGLLRLLNMTWASRGHTARASLALSGQPWMWPWREPPQHADAHLPHTGHL